jgi:proline iminopeptidase
MAATPLFPEIEPFDQGRLNVGHGHALYFEQCGNPKGVAALFLHGGPGAGATAAHRRFFDPAFYRIVIFDQRGAGRSTPLGSLEGNTTPELVSDIETLRRHLGVEKWLVFGGSWGSTLALAYGQAHPERCLGFVLRGIFLCRPQEIDWFLHGMRRFFPDHWQAFAGHLPEDERGDLLGNYHRRLVDPDPCVHMPAARAWSTYEGACSTLRPSPETVAAFASDRMALGLARIEAHYFVNRIFLPENAILEGVSRIRDLPAVIVQGRYDMVCPIASADELARAWPGSYVGQPSFGDGAGIKAAGPGDRPCACDDRNAARRGRLLGGQGFFP